MNSSTQELEIKSQATKNVNLPEELAIPNKTLQLFGVRFNQTTLPAAADMVIKAAIERQRGFVITPNVNMLTLLPFDPGLKLLFNKASLSFVDGWPIVWASNRLEKKGLPERVAGSDVFPLICERAEKNGLTMVLMGAAEGVADEATRRLLISYPKLKILGAYCPPMEDEFSIKSTNEMVAFCNQRKPDILLLGMGFQNRNVGFQRISIN